MVSITPTSCMYLLNASLRDEEKENRLSLFLSRRSPFDRIKLPCISVRKEQKILL